jgi:uncharacterized protein
MLFKILAKRSSDDQQYFYYDNFTNELSDESGQIYVNSEISNNNVVPYASFSKTVPLKKSKRIRLLKIQLGLSCNYSCEYCSQKFVERPPETSKKDIDKFMEQLDSLEFDPELGLKIEFWGGEPFVYWKTLKPLAERLRSRFSSWPIQPEFSVITNGSLLSKKICLWLLAMKFRVGISHDGPGQHIRGPDPFDEPEKRQNILFLYRALKRQNKISFNPVIHGTNYSRSDVHQWFIDLTGDPDVVLGEGGVIDAYDQDAIERSLQTKQEHFKFRQTAFNDLCHNLADVGFINITNKIDTFINDVLTNKNSQYLAQKCGMDQEDVITIDLRGNVITCQNVSAVETAGNGESHLVGHITDMDNVSIKTSTHWSERPDCDSCPVLHLCQGSCMYLQDDYWITSCNNSFSDNIVFFALAFERITGYIPVKFENNHLPSDRQDIWGNILEHHEKRTKIIPIKSVTVKREIEVINNVEVYKFSKV